MSMNYTHTYVHFDLQTPQPTRTHQLTPYVHGSPIETALHEVNSTPSLSNISQFTLDVTTPNSLSSPSLNDPSSSPPQITPLRTTVSAESMGTMTQHDIIQPTPLSSGQTRREVRFSDTITSISPQDSRGSMRRGMVENQQVSSLRVTEMISQLQQNLQVIYKPIKECGYD